MPQGAPVSSFMSNAALAAMPSESLPRDLDARRIAYYLQCCVVGCGIDLSIPFGLLDYTNPQEFPPEHQQLLFLEAIRKFSFEHLLNRSIFIDDRHLVLPQHMSNVFFTAQGPLDVLVLSRLMTSSGHDNWTIEPKAMICTSEWLNMYYLQPMHRYLNREGSTSEPINTDILESNVSQQAETSSHCAAAAHVETIDKDEEFSQVVTQTSCSQQQECIPMAAAVPIEEPTYSRRQETIGASLHFVPGQPVKLCGLAFANMNELVGVVDHRLDDRVIVQLHGHPWRYAVKPENLIILGDDSSSSGNTPSQIQMMA